MGGQGYRARHIKQKPQNKDGYRHSGKVKIIRKWRAVNSSPFFVNIL